MDDSNKKQFVETFNGLAAYYQKPAFDIAVLQIYFNSLAQYDFEQVTWAISKHVADPEHGTFLPRVADIIRQIEGKKPSPSQILALARLADTPLGIMARIKIGTWDLEHQQDRNYLLDRANECLSLFDEWQTRANDGDYTDHEISIMIKHEVSPTSPFSKNCLPVGAEVKARLERRISEIVDTDRHQFLLEKPYTEENNKTDGVHPSITKQLLKIVG